MAQMPRIMVFSRLDAYLFDIDPELVHDASYVDAINGEHSLTITTTQKLEKTDRLLIRDGMGYWYEYVVQGIDDSHDVTVYYCVWSLQYDMAGTFVDDAYGCGYRPGHASVPQSPRKALECALEGTERWTIGTITVTTQSSASFYRKSGWEALQKVIERWGGELSATITVDGTGIVSREVDLLAHIGSTTATRRFDYGHDLKDIKRTTSDDVWPCRIVPLGKSQETDAGGYTRRPDISSVNSDVVYLEDSSVVDLVKVPKPGGGFEYPTAIILNDTYEEPADLKAWGLEHITEYTRPKVSYEASVIQFEQAGMNVHGVALGDNVVAVDREFCGEGLRIDARVVKVAGSLLDASKLNLTIGNAIDTLTNSLMGIARQVSEIGDMLGNSQQFQATADYVSALISRLNDSINATGGYCYITEGEGFVTYDYPVSDPLIGAEATKVVEIRGGNIRIADSRTAGGDWDWKTVIQSGHIASYLITVAQLIAGYIGDPNGNNYWDLDNDTLRIAAEIICGGANNASGTITVLDENGGTLCTIDKDGITNYGAAIRLITDGYKTGAKFIAEMASFVIPGYVDGVKSPYARKGLHIYGDGNNYDEDVYLTIGSTGSGGAGQQLRATSSLVSSGPMTIEPCNSDDDVRSVIKFNESGGVDVTGGTSTSTYRLVTDDASVRVVKSGTVAVRATGGSGSGSANLYVNGTVTEASDRRLKRHLSYLSDDACDFIRNLKPALFEMGGDVRPGFYAQDVENADPWRSTLVGEIDPDGDGDPIKTLDYMGLVAPLVTYCQQLERRIEALEERIGGIE